MATKEDQEKAQTNLGKTDGKGQTGKDADTTSVGAAQTEADKTAASASDVKSETRAKVEGGEGDSDEEGRTERRPTRAGVEVSDAALEAQTVEEANKVAQDEAPSDGTDKGHSRGTGVPEDNRMVEPEVSDDRKENLERSKGLDPYGIDGDANVTPKR